MVVLPEEKKGGEIGGGVRGNGATEGEGEAGGEGGKGGGVTCHNVSLDRAGERPRCDDRGDK